MVLLTGCVTPWEKNALLGSRASIDGVQGPTERRLRNLFHEKKKEEDAFDVSGALKPIPGTDEYLAAEEIYEGGDYQAAEKAFHRLAIKHRSPASWTWDLITGQEKKHRPHANSPIREDALFMQAESQYQQQHFADANDSYAELLKDYPSTRHLDDVTKRLFEVARMWLDFPNTAELSEVQQVNYDDFHRKLPAEEPTAKRHTPVYVPNFIDEKRPLFDTEGNAISALRMIWLNDPTGPLADDALMMTASHYARRGNWIESDRHYTLLREEYPNSPHVQTAFVIGSHVKLMAYEGPAYDGKSLEDAEHLKESLLRLYPASEDRKRVEGELQKIEEAKAARLWELVDLYGGKRKPRSEAVYCHLILDRYADTSYAELARNRLQELGPEYDSGAKLLQAIDEPPRSIFAAPGSAFRPHDPPRLFGVAVGRKSDESEEVIDAPSEDEAEPKPSFWALPGSASKRKVKPESSDAETEEAVVDDASPRRRWFGSRDDTLDEPESPVEDGMETDATESDDDAKEPGRLGRLFRFTPPKRLDRDDDAQPESDSGKTKL
jgi:outer membrane protein assembly factor BamD (BamD/ComL family)